MFFLVYFEGPGSAIARIERECNLSEQVLRSMMIRAEHLTREQMEAADGQAKLADEIKLRGAAEEEKVPAPAAMKDDAAPNEPPVVVTEATEDMPATSDA